MRLIFKLYSKGFGGVNDCSKQKNEAMPRFLLWGGQREIEPSPNTTQTFVISVQRWLSGIEPESREPQSRVLTVTP